MAYISWQSACIIQSCAFTSAEYSVSNFYVDIQITSPCEVLSHIHWIFNNKTPALYVKRCSCPPCSLYIFHGCSYRSTSMHHGSSFLVLVSILLQVKHWKPQSLQFFNNINLKLINSTIFSLTVHFYMVLMGTLFKVWPWVNWYYCFWIGFDFLKRC